MKIKLPFKITARTIIIALAIFTAIVLCIVFLTGNKNKIKYKVAEVTLSDIQSVVQATGTVQPVETVDVGTQISGRIEELYFDYNSKVEKGQLIALMDSSTYEATKLDAQANVASCKSDIESAQVALEKAKLDYDRAVQLSGEDLIAKSELDGYRTTYKKALATLSQAKSKLLQAKANLRKAEINLNYTKIYSPVSGVVTTKNVEKGQTVAASYQTPSIAKIAKDLTAMQVEANVDEADIGYIKEGQKAVFDVDSYPDTKFEGVVTQLRLSPTTTNNVVTYTVIVRVDNKDQKLLPGMTANIEIIREEKHDVKCVPNSAFRFKPQETEIKSEGFAGGFAPGPRKENNKNKENSSNQAEDMATIYTLVKGKPVAVNVQTGITDGTKTEIKSDIELGTKVIVGIDIPSDKN